MLHNEDVYPDPFTFNPDRFIGESGNIDKSIRDPGHACWGFGRRYVLRIQGQLFI
jgi:cytochrome P450